MRCRKVRSLLSAACSDELGGRQQVAVREHLASCPSCRTEASYYGSIRQAARELPQRETLSEDFNARLLDRVARERFAETRSKAYLPKRAPRIVWWKLAPVMATAAVLAVVAINLQSPEQPLPMSSAVTTNPGHLDDSYMTAQPTNNPNVTVDLQEGWTLNQQLARSERLEQISRSLTNRHGFGFQHLASGRTTPTPGIQPPAQIFFQKNGPVFRIYRVGGRTGAGEDSLAY